MMWEMEIHQSGDWLKVGFDAPGGFMPYRYEDKRDAEECVNRCYPKLSASAKRVMPAVGRKEPNYAHHS